MDLFALGVRLAPGLPVKARAGPGRRAVPAAYPRDGPTRAADPRALTVSAAGQATP